MYHEEHPTGQQYAQYLRVVAHMHELQVVLETDVTAVTPICQCHDDDHGHFEVSVMQSPGATHAMSGCRQKLPPTIRAKFVIWAAGEFQYPRCDGFPGASENCVHNSRIRSWTDLAESSNGEMVVIGGYESGIDAAVHLANAGVDVTVLASTPFWSVRTLDPSTELAPFTAGRLRSAMDGSHPPTLLSGSRVVSVEKDEQDGGYVVTAVKTSETQAGEILTLQVRRPPTGFGVFLQTSTVVAVEVVNADGPAAQAGFEVGDVVVALAGVRVEGREPYGLVEAMERVKTLLAEGQEVFEWTLRRAPPQQDTRPAGDADGADDHPSQDDTVRVKTSAKPVLATGFNSGVGEVVNHLFDWTEEALCSSGNGSAAEEKGARGHAPATASATATAGAGGAPESEGGSGWGCSDTRDLLEQHTAPGGGALAGLTRQFQLAEAAKAELERELPEAICAGGSRAAVTTVAYETLSNNVERLRGDLAAAHAAAQASSDEASHGGIRAATNLQELVLALVEVDPSIDMRAKAVKAAIENVRRDISFEVTASELKPKALAKMIGKKPKGEGQARSCHGLAAGPSETAPLGDPKLTARDESTICPGLFLCGPQVG
jgi:hypothetical protein